LTDVLGDLADRHNLTDIRRTSARGLRERYLYSPDMRYRYAFARWWDSPDLGGLTAWILLNPATGDTEQRYRPTLERCIDWSHRWQSTGLVILNLFAYRATDPRALRVAEDPIGPDTDDVLTSVTDGCARTIAAWGANGRLRGRSAAVGALLREPWCLGVTQHGEPRHPLYVNAAAERIRWEPPDRS